MIMKTAEQKIVPGDKVFARLAMKGRVVAELVLDSLYGMTDLLSELRRRAPGVRGLATLYVRNQSRGWCVERPLMLYHGNFERNSSSSLMQCSGNHSHNVADTCRRMQFPWTL